MLVARKASFKNISLIVAKLIWNQWHILVCIIAIDSLVYITSLEKNKKNIEISFRWKKWLVDIVLRHSNIILIINCSLYYAFWPFINKIQIVNFICRFALYQNFICNTLTILLIIYMYAILIYRFKLHWKIYVTLEKSPLPIWFHGWCCSICMFPS